MTQILPEQRLESFQRTTEIPLLRPRHSSTIKWASQLPSRVRCHKSVINAMTLYCYLRRNVDFLRICSVLSESTEHDQVFLSVRPVHLIGSLTIQDITFHVRMRILQIFIKSFITYPLDAFLAHLNFPTKQDLQTFLTGLNTDICISDQTVQLRIRK